MKSGATDPFADDESDDSDDSVESDGSDGPVTPNSVTDTTVQDNNESAPTSTSNTTTSASNTNQFDRSDLPYVLRREKVKEERDKVHQLFVLSETDRKEIEARRELEDRLGDVYKLDAREAIYRAGIENLDDAEAVLREWGVDL